MDFFHRINEYKSKLPSPGTFDSLQNEVKGVLPSVHMVEGAKFDLTSVLNPNFQVTHSFSWGSSQYPPMYHFGAGYSTARYMLQGHVDHDGSLQARANYNWIPLPQPTKNDQGELQPAAELPVTSTSKLVAQLTKVAENNMIQFEHEHKAIDYSLSLKAINANALEKDITGIFTGSYLQSLTKNLALGFEYILQRPSPDRAETAFTLAAKYACFDELPNPPSLPLGMPSPYAPLNPKNPTSVLTATFTPSNGIFSSSYWRRLNQRLELGAECQLLVAPTAGGRREGLAQFGFKMDTVYATLRGMIDTHGKVTSVIEERIAPGLSISLCGELDYSKGNGGQGRVGLGFNLEA